MEGGFLGIKISVVFYDENGLVVDTFCGNIDLDSLPPREKICFDVYLIDRWVGYPPKTVGFCNILHLLRLTGRISMFCHKSTFMI